MLGLRATIEVLKQLPVIAKRNELAKATEHFIPRTRMFAEPPPSPPLRFCTIDFAHLPPPIKIKKLSVQLCRLL